MSNSSRNIYFDFIKGIAIIAIVLYHFGGNVLPYGYLGVDIFFVIAGFLLFKSLLKEFQNNTFNYWQFIFRKLVRLWPLIIIISIVSMFVGYFLMLPDDYENLAESVIASSIFSNNILQCITTKNYWDIVNLYKPLMHLWYIGVLMEAYIIIPLIVLFANKILPGEKRRLVILTALGLTILSFFLFICPKFTDAQKFYYLPFRLFEISAGGILLARKPALSKKNFFILGILSFVLLLSFLTLRVDFFSAKTILVLTCICTLIYIISFENKQYNYRLFNFFVNIVASIGKRSYSIYLWHQLIVAFMFYSFVPVQSFNSFLLFILLVSLVSFLSYKYVELPLSRAIKFKKKELMINVTTLISAIFVCSYSFFIFDHAGVVRDIKELDVLKNSIHRGMHAEYCDRPFQWNKDFEDNGKIKVLVIGNSFGRDWANILYEWDVGKKLQISYIFPTKQPLKENTLRLKNADIVFYVNDSDIDFIKKFVSNTKLYVVGGKNYGASNGIIYARRYSKNYYESYTLVNDDLLRMNRTLAIEYGEHFIDMMSPIMVDSEHAAVFTDEKKFISQDCRHLTKAGALYYARILDIGRIFDKVEKKAFSH